MKGNTGTDCLINYNYVINPLETPGESIAIIQQDIDPTGVNNICFGFEVNGSEEEIIASMKLFQFDVMPYLKEKQ
ncbi:alkane 1-monooxygenase [Vibrio campbellii CAIM 519 = NBRC 15631 = ATCC 25920]|uniref:Luciferase A n=1 Tax=Vibrio campbellii TaxID=680 RepID=F8UV19_9VIBR|nr:luciferase A [Vibrio campbellii]ARV74203.1 alkane 1-monooxygenase [Vibrio campbellii CAIM 519 = NBRC 15631 = ATCC 25920]ELU50293.1 LuxA protein [Vibrio campbellii CAIM 519 = NBRC 15631 = ATCC 25920]